MSDAWRELNLPLDMSVVLSELPTLAVVCPSVGSASVDEHKLAKHLIEELKKSNLIVGVASDTTSASSPVPKGKAKKKKGEAPHRQCGDVDCDKILANLMAYIEAKLIVRGSELGFHDNNLLDGLVINMAAHFGVPFNKIAFDITLNSHKIFREKAHTSVRSAGCEKYDFESYCVVSSD